MDRREAPAKVKVCPAVAVETEIPGRAEKVALAMAKAVAEVLAKAEEPNFCRPAKISK